MSFKNSIYGSLLLLVLMSCKKEITNQYEIDDVTLYSNASEKKNLKNNEQFISVLYTDLFGKSISISELNALNSLYTSIGDKAVAIDLIIKSTLANENAIVPEKSEMKEDTDLFVNEAFKRFYIRKPSPQEKWFVVNKIDQDTSLQPVDIYYAILTSEEYRYY
jgi:hypothetical protein